MYIPRCINEACTGLNYTGYVDSRIKNTIQGIGYETIQDAINEVSTDDVITVESGVYTEDIELKW